MIVHKGILEEAQVYLTKEVDGGAQAYRGKGDSDVLRCLKTQGAEVLVDVNW